MTAPELVELIAEALLSIELGRAFDRNEDMVAFKEDLEACRMDARAVLDALTEAGTVEWGVGYPSGYTAIATSEGRAREYLAESLDGTLVSRLTLPWTGVQ